MSDNLSRTGKSSLRARGHADRWDWHSILPLYLGQESHTPFLSVARSNRAVSTFKLRPGATPHPPRFRRSQLGS
jgi:hypothetical protein